MQQPTELLVKFFVAAVMQGEIAFVLALIINCLPNFTIPHYLPFQPAAKINISYLSLPKWLSRKKLPILTQTLNLNFQNRNEI